MQKLKEHSTYGTVEATKVAFGVFSLFALASIVTISKHQTNPNTTYTEKVMNKLHEVNDIYDVTLNKIHHLFYSTDITTNEILTFREAMKQEDRTSFVDTTEKEIRDYEEVGHRKVVHCSTLPNKAFPIK